MDSSLFADRRRRFAEKMEPNSVAIFSGSREAVRNHDVPHPFRQNSDFFYLTGFEEPDSFALIVKEADGSFRYVLLVQPRKIEDEIWNGERAGTEGAMERFGADQAFDATDCDKDVARLIDGRDALYHPIGRQTSTDRKVTGWWNASRRMSRAGVSAPSTLIDPTDILARMRLIKTPAEIEIMRTAGAMTREAHKEAMRATRPGLNESDIEALITFFYRKNGSKRDGYNNIVAGGAGACILHYVANDKPLNDGDLLLIDSGAEYQYYSADITCTFPINGRFSEKQAEVYNVVLASHQAAIAACKPGNTMEQVHHTARNVLLEWLIGKGFIEGTVESIHAAEEELIAKRREERAGRPIKVEDLPYKQFYPHGTGHWLGLDVHDAGPYRTSVEQSIPLEPGMVLTIEPGLYFYRGYENVPADYADIGIRIEDDILVTETGPDNLTAGTPRTIEEVEATMAEEPSIRL